MLVFTVSQAHMKDATPDVAAGGQDAIDSCAAGKIEGLHPHSLTSSCLISAA